MIKVNGKEVEWHEGMTIKSIVNILEYAEWYHPILIVSLNGKHVPFKKFYETPVADGDEITVFLSLAGG